VSRNGVGVSGNRLELPPMSLAVLLSSTEQTEDRAVQKH
jgi:hypothetical protein